MSTRTPMETVKPAFNFDPVEEPNDTEALHSERESFKAKTAEAFGKADYVSPDKRTAQKQSSKPRTAKKPNAKQQSVEKLPFRRPRGRPPGRRQHSLSVKTTEDHLAFLYGVAGSGELVGVLEAALEALAREVIQAGSYQGLPLEKEILDRAKALAGS